MRTHQYDGTVQFLTLGFGETFVEPVDAFRACVGENEDIEAINAAEEFALLQEMNTRIDPFDKLECFCVSTICEHCKNSCFQTSLEGGPIRVDNLL